MCESPKTERSPLLHTHATTSNSPPTDAEIRSSDANDRSKKKKKNSISVIIFGQVVALTLACGNASAAALQNQYQIHLPTCLTGLVYFVLSFHIIWLWRQRTTQETKIQTCYKFPFTSLQLYTPWYIYLLLSILDVEANYLAMLSFQQTKLSSSMLLTSLSVLSTVLLRKLIFGSNTSKARLFGVFMCIVGGCLCLQEDVHHNEQIDDRDLSRESQIYLHGDLLALVAAVLYGLNDVLAEYFVKNNDRVEYLGMIGLFGMMFSFCVQTPLLEGHDLVTKFSQRRNGTEESDFFWMTFLLFCFVAMLSLFYVAVSIFLSKNDATILNLSLQSCPLWAVVLSMMGKMFTPGEVNLLPPPIFFVALILVAVGTFSYEREEERRMLG